MGHSTVIQQLSLVFASMFVSKVEPFYYEVDMGVAMALHCRLKHHLFASIALYVVLHSF